MTRGFKIGIMSRYAMLSLLMLIFECCAEQIFRKEPFFYGHDNHDQLVKIAKVSILPRNFIRTCSVLNNFLILYNILMFLGNIFFISV